MTLAYLAVEEEPSSWIAIWLPIGISLLALVGTIGNFLLILYRGRKRVRLKSSLVRSSLDRSPLAVEEPTEIYRCLVTNTGYIGVEIARVELRRSAEGSSEIVSQLLRAGQPRKLDQGEPQAWEIYLDELKERLQGETKVIAVAVDTTGREHVQKRKDAVAIPGAQ